MSRALGAITDTLVSELGLHVVSQLFEDGHVSTIVKDSYGTSMHITEHIKDDSTDVPMKWFGDNGDTLIGILWESNRSEAVQPESFVHALRIYGCSSKISKDRESLVMRLPA